MLFFFLHSAINAITALSNFKSKWSALDVDDIWKQISLISIFPYSFRSFFDNIFSSICPKLSISLRCKGMGNALSSFLCGRLNWLKQTKEIYSNIQNIFSLICIHKKSINKI